ncbi:single-stranded DNA-binding protein [Syntrophomonas wolfei]|uniref:Single-stranded DNA-binding protein n=1 Tax=Syntrophomonas wolfei subsp. wolfei (strain DSM 2245B / Goettingen) TaxID=335541 RepID=Q0ATX7_SYNWW|nr:single-stranded DNA-binding protein [Syntrophomonas wolfei]ABI69827.1 single-strand binding protein [Syntrophomonas wolfei subsp. wolfei str. Goettingen G311]
MLNRVILIGRLTKDPELRYTQNGTAVATFTLAVDRKYKREETDFIPIVVWAKQAENCANYLNKGSLVAIEGRIQVRTYDNQEGQRRWVTEVVAEDVRFMGKPAGSRGSTPDYADKTSKRDFDDNWSDLGREVNMDNIDLVDQHEDEDIPF